MGRKLPAEERALRIADDLAAFQSRVTSGQIATASLVALNGNLQNCILALRNFGAVHAASKKRKGRS